ncbi:MAG: kynureninase [Cytophagales bacterium]|nr:kynureninase [Cytophagales bacterium]
MLTEQHTLQFAQDLDKNDELAKFRDYFFIPQQNHQEVIYLCGNSLGLQPKSTPNLLKEELEKWAKFGVEGHFEGKQPWWKYRLPLKTLLSSIIEAKESEITVMNNLSSNIHLLLVSFYEPKGKRTKILMEAGAFPSDQYIVETHLQTRNLIPQEHIVELSPRIGEHTLRTEDILATIEQLGEELALVFLGGVNYYTGQLFDLQKITEKTHQVGAIAGFDLAHAIGNVRLSLHDWNVDFAAWCSYKYLNSSPGGVSGVFIHQKHHSKDLKRFGGWWGQKEEERFLMKKGFKPMSGADGWQLSNEPILAMAAHQASLEIFAEAQMPKLLKKSKELSGFLYELLLTYANEHIEIITPKNPEERGAQLSILAKKDGKKLHQYLSSQGVITDWREPNVIRMAPVPLYNSFEDVWRAAMILVNFYKPEN